MLLTPSDMKTLKYNNLTNLTGMIWHIDPATKILETNQFWKLTFRIRASFKSRKWPICLPEGSKATLPRSLKCPAPTAASGRHVWGEPIGTGLGVPMTTNDPPSDAEPCPRRGRTQRRRGGASARVRRELYPWACPIRVFPQRRGRAAIRDWSLRGQIFAV